MPQPDALRDEHFLRATETLVNLFEASQGTDDRWIIIFRKRMIN